MNSLERLVTESKWKLPYIKTVRVLARKLRSGASKKSDFIADKRPQALFIDEYCPFGRVDAGSTRARLIMENLLTRGYQIALVAPDNNCTKSHSLHLAGILHLQKLSNLGTTTKCDFAWVSRALVFRDFHEDLANRFPKMPILLDMVDLQSRTISREAKLARSQGLLKLSNRVRKLEREVVRKANVCVFVSEEEASVFGSDLESNSFILPTIHQVPEKLKISGKKSGIVFVANFQHEPNVTGLKWFLREVWPEVSPRTQAEKLFVVGKNVPASLRAMANENVDFLGYVGDISQVLGRVQVNIAPLVTGAGVKGKISEASGYGLPTLTTAIGAEGMGLTDGFDVIIRDSSSEFASALDDLILDELLREKISLNALAGYNAKHSPSALHRSLDSILEKLSRL